MSTASTSKRRGERIRRHEDGDRAGPDPEPPACRSGRTGARRRHRRGTRAAPRGWPLPRLRHRLTAARRGLPLRGGGTAARSDRCPRARRRSPAPPRAAAHARVLPRRPRARAWLEEGVLRLRRPDLRRSLAASRGGGEARRSTPPSVRLPAASSASRSRPKRQRISCCSTGSSGVRRQSSPCSH